MSSNSAPRSDLSLDLPVIDLSPFLQQCSDKAIRADIAEQWDRALSDVGFAAITGHGLRPSLIHDLYSAATTFFEQPLDQKMKSSFADDYGSAPGYTRQGVESVSRSQSGDAPADLVESFVFRSEEDIAMLPAEPEGFSTSLVEYWREVDSIMHVLHGLSEEVLGFSFEPYYSRDASRIIRLAYYPPMDPSQASNAVRYGAHTDYQGFTILRADPLHPGLEVLSKGQWMKVDFSSTADDVLLVNIGDLFQRWTNDRWKATLHRVQNPPPDSMQAQQARLSLVTFTGPSDKSLIETIPTCIGPNGEKYEPIYAGEHLRLKLIKK